MVATGLTGVYAETIPNFEVLTLVVFCAGVLLGARDGVLVGVVTTLVYSLLNPYGAVHPLVTLSQVAGEAVAGAAGAWIALGGIATGAAGLRATVLVLAAIAITAFYDLVTNLATGLLFGQVGLTLIGGIPFSLWHIGSNVALFALIGTPLVRVLARYRSRLSQ
jgi:hypothetical protein